MKIIQNNFNPATESNNIVDKAYPKFYACEYCESEFEYDKADIEIGAIGGAYVKCPCCGKRVFLEDEEGVVLTKDNVHFPVHYFHTCKEEGAVDICTDENIREYINKAIDYFRRNKEEDFWYCGSGNFTVFVIREGFDEDYLIFVTNNYYETFIPFEDRDY